MGFEREDLRGILGALMGLERRDALLVLGDAVVHCDGPTLQQLANERAYPLAPPAARLDAMSLGSALGFQRVETLDIAGGASVQLNLHDDPPPDLVDAFDCVIDAGVLFWCSDP